MDARYEGRLTVTLPRDVVERVESRDADVTGTVQLAPRTEVSGDHEPRAQSVEVTNDRITAHLTDGRTISVPLAWSWRLSEATPEQRRHWELIADGTGIRWPDIDEDISVRGMLDGVPARRGRA